jgi:hypothetical protein
MSASTLIEAVKAEGFDWGGVVAAAFGDASATSSRRRCRSDTIADQDDAHPHVETTGEPGAEAKAGLAMYQGQRP